MTGALARLSHAINTARQLAEALRAIHLDAEQADMIGEHLRAAQKLVQGRPAVGQIVAGRRPPKVQTGTTRYRLWRRSPLCFWCGRVTRIEGVHERDAATIEHVYAKGHPKRCQPERAHLPLFVLACRECNNNRGSPARMTAEACPVV